MTELHTMSVHALSEKCEQLQQQIAAKDAELGRIDHELGQTTCRMQIAQIKAENLEKELGRVRSAPAWKSAKDGNDWPKIGEKYLVRLNDTLQHEIYEFDQGDSGFGFGEYFWSRDDLDECPAFDHENDEWLPLEALDHAALASPAAEPVLSESDLRGTGSYSCELTGKTMLTRCATGCGCPEIKSAQVAQSGKTINIGTIGHVGSNKLGVGVALARIMEQSQEGGE